MAVETTVKRNDLTTLKQFFHVCFDDIGSIEGPDGKRYVALGCFKDSKSFRALPDLVGNMRGKIDWHNMAKTVKECAHEVVVKNSTLKVTTSFIHNYLCIIIARLAR